MQSAKCKHCVCRTGVEAATPSTPFLRTPVVFAFCILHFALLSATSCAKSPPQPPSAPQIDPARQLATDIAAATQMPGVQRATWGIAIQSLTNNERLFDLNAARMCPLRGEDRQRCDGSGCRWMLITGSRRRLALPGGSDVVLQGDRLISLRRPAIAGLRRAISRLVAAFKAPGNFRPVTAASSAWRRVRGSRAWFAWSWMTGYSRARCRALNLPRQMTVTVAPGAAAGSPTLVSVTPNAGRPARNRVSPAPPKPALVARESTR